MCFASVLGHASNCTAIRRTGSSYVAGGKASGKPPTAVCCCAQRGCSPLFNMGGLWAEPRKTACGKKSLEMPPLLRSHSASPQGPKESDAFPKVTNVPASSGFQCWVPEVSQAWLGEFPHETMWGGEKKVEGGVCVFADSFSLWMQNEGTGGSRRFATVLRTLFTP